MMPTTLPTLDACSFVSLLQVQTKFFLAVKVVGLLNSECSQQNRANENKHGAYRQHIEIQGTVIGLAADSYAAAYRNLTSNSSS